MAVSHSREGLMKKRASKLKLKSKETSVELCRTRCDESKLKPEQSLQYYPGFFHVKYLVETFTFLTVATLARLITAGIKIFMI